MAEKEGVTCREKIMSEEYRDFIYEQNMPFEMEIVQDGKLCEQEIGFYYRAVYLNKLYTDPITLNRFSYGSIPKCYIPLDTEMLDQAGIAQVQNYPTLKLMGEGVMLGIIDTGIDYLNPIFRNVDGSTRIAGIWDQTIQTGNAPEGFLYGTEYTRGQINEAVRSERPMEIVPSVDEDGHGTFIAGVAAGGENVEEGFLGAAPKATLGIVKLKEAKVSKTILFYRRKDKMLSRE